MEETRRVRNLVARYAIVVAAAAEVISLFFTKGFDAAFLYGLTVGTAVGIVNFSLLAFVLSKSITLEKAGAGVFFVFVFILRLFIYGGAFVVAYKTGLSAGIACIIGFITVKVSIFIVNFIKKSIFPEEDNLSLTIEENTADSVAELKH